MNKLFISFITIAAIFVSASPALAVDSTSSATTDMESKIKNLVQENLSTTEAKLKEKVNLQTLVGYVGKIKTISSNNLTVDSQGTLLQVTTNTKTVFQKDGSAIKLAALAIEDKIILIGTSVKEDIIQAKKISYIKEDTSDQVITSVIVGKISAIDIKKKTINLTVDGIDQTYTLSKKSTVKLDSFKEGQNILGIVKLYQGKYSISRAKAL